MDLIVTNNPMAAERFAGRGRVCFYPEESYRDILRRVRDLVYVGHRLRNHPLYGSLRPHETPYRTVVLSEEAMAPDGEECTILSDALTLTAGFTLPDVQAMDRDILRDYQYIDCDLVSAVWRD